MDTQTLDKAGQLTAVQHYRPLSTLIPAHWQQGDVIANGIRHHYYRTGDGNKPPVVLLHGILDGAVTWLRTAKALEADYDVIMIDTRGHGRSDGVETGYTAHLLMEDAAGVMRALNIKKARIIGHSQGGNTAVRLAAAYPELVHSVILEGAGDGQEGGAADFGDLANSPHYQAWLEGYTAWMKSLRTMSHEEQLAAGLSQLPPGTAVMPEEEYVPWLDISATLDLELMRLSGSLWSQLAENGREMVAAIEQTTCPLLIMKSSFTFGHTGPASVVEEPSERPNVRMVHFLNTSHLIHREQFELFMATVREFFK